MGHVHKYSELALEEYLHHLQVVKAKINTTTESNLVKTKYKSTLLV